MTKWVFTGKELRAIYACMVPIQYMFLVVVVVLVSRLSLLYILLLCIEFSWKDTLKK